MKERAVDLHVHTNEAYFKIANEEFHHEGVGYSLLEAIETAYRAGLSGIAITNHNLLVDIDEGAQRAAQLGLLLLQGIEFSSRYKNRNPHIIGIFSKIIRVGRKLLPVYEQPRKIIDWIHKHEGVAIGAHPTSYTDATSFTYTEIAEEFGQHLDGVEADTLFISKTELKKIATDLNLAAVAGSDSHILDTLGYVSTVFSENCTSAKDIIAAIRNKQFTTRRKNILAYMKIILPEVGYFGRLLIATRFRPHLG